MAAFNKLKMKNKELCYYRCHYKIITFKYLRC